MLGALVRFEWRYHTRQASFFAAAALFLLFGATLTLTGFGIDSIAVNSPYNVTQSLAFASLLSVFVAAVFAAGAVLRDDEHRMLEIVYSTPVTKLLHLFGRFSGAYLAASTAVLLTAVGMVAATFSPTVTADRLAPLNLLVYLWPALIVTLPNVLFATSVIFAIAVLTRNTIATYVGAVMLYVLYFVASALSNSPLMAASTPGTAPSPAAALLDPFALSSFFEMTSYWSIAQKNSRFVPLSGSLLLNRLVWLAITGAIFTFVYRTFQFRTLRRVKAGKSAEQIEFHDAESIRYATVSPRRGGLTQWLASYLSATRIELASTVLRIPFLLIVVAWMAVAASELYSGILEIEFGSRAYPVTGAIFDVLSVPTSMMGLILVVYFTAEIVWRERRYRFSPILDATPAGGSVMIAAKLSAIAGMLAAFLGTGALTGFIVQLLTGYANFEPQIYLGYFYFAGMPLLLLGALAIFVHSLTPNRYAGMVTFVIVAILFRQGASVGLDHPLLRFGGLPSIEHSDMAGWGPLAPAFHWLTLHWAVVSALLLSLSAIMWRGLGRPLRERLRLMASHRQRLVPAMLLAASFLTGGWIFYNTNVLNSYRGENEILDWRAEYERTYRNALGGIPKPSMTDLDLKVELHPQRGSYHAAGTYRIVNPSARPMGTIHMAIRREAEIESVTLDGRKPSQIDSKFGMVRFDLPRPLQPGESATVAFSLAYERRGFTAAFEGRQVIENGSYLMNLRAFPTFGYRRSYEINDPRERMKRGLGRTSRPELEEAGHGEIEDFDQPVNVALVVSTDGDQRVVAPGTLQRSWSAGGRNHYAFKTDVRIPNRFVIASARWAFQQQHHRGVDIELFYHPTHSMNVDRIMAATKTSLDLFQKSFGPYPQKQLRLAEVPLQDFAGYATPGATFYGEERLFLFDVRDPHRSDMVSRRVAHEVAHQWFGHQLVPPSTAGATMLVETLTKYAEVMAVRAISGEKKLRRLQEIELVRYLSGRSREPNAEVPLYRVGSQGHLFYAKGSIVMQGIRDLIGEEAVNDALRATLRTPRPTTLNLLAELHRVTREPEHRALIDEWLKLITLYDFKVESATARKRPDDQWDVTVRIAAAKVQADGEGNETPMKFREPIEIELVDESFETAVYTARHPLHDGMNELRLVLGKKPGAVSVDPDVLRIDKSPTDNAKRVE